MTILIVEDDSMTRKALEHRMKKDGYSVICAADGLEAISIMKTEKVDIILTDVHMPNMSGLDLVRSLRNDLKSNVPIVILTRIGLEETVLQAFELGADDYLLKPFNPDDLSLRIKKIMIKFNLT